MHYQFYQPVNQTASLKEVNGTGGTTGTLDGTALIEVSKVSMGGNGAAGTLNVTGNITLGGFSQLIINVYVSGPVTNDQLSVGGTCLIRNNNGDAETLTLNTIGQVPNGVNEGFDFSTTGTALTDPLGAPRWFPGAVNQNGYAWTLGVTNGGKNFHANTPP